MGIVLATLICVGGCGGENGQAEDVIVARTQFLTDPSGTITVSITDCGVFAFTGGFGTTSCPVLNGFVLVGGGARVVGEPVPGGLLQASRPSGQSWFAQAKDHVSPSSFRLQAASIGLKLQGVSQNALLGMVTVTTANTTALGASPNHSPIAIAQPPAGTVVLGGGAAVHDLGGQQLLVQSLPLEDGSTPTGWVAISKDHEIPYLDTVDAYVISIPACPAGFSRCLSSTVTTFSSWFGGGYRSAINFTDTAVTGVGAAAFYTGAGRLLTAIWPANPGLAQQNSLLVDSKDHDIPDSGWTNGFQLNLSAN